MSKNKANFDLTENRNMKSQNLIQELTYNFSLEIIKRFCRKQDYDKASIYNQLVKSSTSIGANVEESIGAHSKKDFLNKITIAYKEARETRYWIRLLKDSNNLDNESAGFLLTKIDQIIRVLGTIQKTTKSNL